MRALHPVCAAALSHRSAAAWSSAARAEETLPPAKVVGQFLEQYCLDCHDSSTKKGKRDLESFQLPLKVRRRTSFRPGTSSIRSR